MDWQKEWWMCPLELMHKALPLDMIEESEMAVAEAQGLVIL
jgi:hypothetical protein